MFETHVPSILDLLGTSLVRFQVCTDYGLSQALGGSSTRAGGRDPQSSTT